MNSFFDFDAQRIGWTLLHSLWQGAAIFLLTLLVVRIIPTRHSTWRYAASCAGMFAIVIASVITFSMIDKRDAHVTASHDSFLFAPIELRFDSPEETLSLAGKAEVFVENNMSTIVVCWLIGAALFLIRLLSSWWYIQRIQQGAFLIENKSSDLLAELANRMNISRAVRLAESVRVTAPLVVGYLKPMILFPMGMTSGLTMKELEMIFVHELAHIRRHDYLVNAVQAFVETVFFFNPFIWILSSLVRREREFCCDDLVLMEHKDPLQYARTLVLLRERQINTAPLAVPLASEKNQLLNRIKRIMEKSTGHYSDKTRLIPVAIVIVGLLCASWLSVKTDTVGSEEQNVVAVLSPDTTIKKKEGSYRRMTIVTFDDKGEPHEEVIEEYSGDEDFDLGLRSEVFNFSMPVAPMAPDFPSAPGFPSMPAFVSPPDFFEWSFDTLPPGFIIGDEEDWQKFSKEFEAAFREKFEDFYEGHEQEMKELMDHMKKNFSHDPWHSTEHSQAFFKSLEELEVPFEEEQLRELEAMARRMEDHARELPMPGEPHEPVEFLEQLGHLHSQHDRLREIEWHNHDRIREFEVQLKQMLVDDGYLKADEKINSISWESAGEIKVNGKNLKKEDYQKYNDFHLKYFPKGGHFRYVE